MRAVPLSAKASFALATTAFTVGFASTGSAALISEVPAGYGPRSFTPGFVSGSFDVSGAGFAPVTISGTSGKTDFGKADTLSFSVGTGSSFAIVSGSNTSFGGSILATSPSPFTVNASGASSSFAYVVNKSGSSSFSTAPSYAALSFSENGVATNGYIQGTYDGRTFTLLDYGLITVPEPASLALLATGIAGIAAMRRRRSAS